MFFESVGLDSGNKIPQKIAFRYGPAFSCPRCAQNTDVLLDDTPVGVAVPARTSQADSGNSAAGQVLGIGYRRLHQSNCGPLRISARQYAPGTDFGRYYSRLLPYWAS